MSKDINILFSSKSDDWATPVFIYNQVISLGMFDPCPFLGKENSLDGLSIDWKKTNFCNPPYSEVKKWVLKGFEEHRKHREVIFLVYAKTDTKWFRFLWEYGCDFHFITGRLKFNETKWNCPMPCVLIKLTGKLSRCYLVEREKIDLKEILDL